MFKKEGGKVKGYYTTKKLILGAVKGFIVTVRMGLLRLIILTFPNLSNINMVKCPCWMSDHEGNPDPIKQAYFIKSFTKWKS